ncbi:cobalt-precorrin-5B (C1)-methyltransferase [Desulfohalotomaculum tongense]|uniref:cobalt-precorrin-5B (C(1))-methyltransferase CbiD n=1 Tax=Desulforadius tongensis TaxID=1216062 RepID=UPI00195E4C7F|nr:cobalt-precorrin-5B (C(1))-methyltransferase CbiD [Desulforadius tongensis]MBM7854345.1 cobalt-precorrin-5B (C1)-methyltransferase [Desulforadius tongensis]
MIKDSTNSGTNKKLRTGYTTGTCAAAAAKAAALALFRGEKPPAVSVDLPGGGSARLPVRSLILNDGFARAAVIKDGGDDPDVTHGLEIWAAVYPASRGITVTGGTGVGRVTKPGLQVPVGEYAINPAPRRMITAEVQKVLPAGKGAKVVISVPGGAEVAKRTMNQRLGIVGGISILGTGGIVRPMSEDAYRRSLVPQIDVALAQGYRHLVLTPGRMGVKRAGEMGIPAECVVETSNFIGTMLEECAKRKVPGVIILGHLGKLVKLAGGIFHTHSKMADARREILAAHAALHGADYKLVRQIMELNTVDQSVELLRKNGLMKVFSSIAGAAEERCTLFCYHSMEVGTVIYSMAGEVVGCSRTARKIGGVMGWQIP